jgi:hypothetical protein
MSYAPIYGRDVFSTGSRTSANLVGTTALGGGVWAYSPGANSTSNVPLISAAGRVYLSAGTTNCDVLLGNLATSADGRAGIWCYPITTGVSQNFSVATRMAGTAQTYFDVQYNSGSMSLYQFVAGTVTKIGNSVTYTPSTSNPFLLIVEAIGPVVSAYVFDTTNGWLKTTSNTFQATPIAFASGNAATAIASTPSLGNAGYSGITWYLNPVTATTGIHISEFNAGSGFLLTPNSAIYNSVNTLAVEPVNVLYNTSSPPVLTATGGSISTALTLTNSFAGSVGYTAPLSGATDTLSDGTFNSIISLTGPRIYPSNSSLGTAQTLHLTSYSFTGGGVIWTYGNGAVATVNSSTGVVSAVGVGTTTITATGVSDNTQVATSTITVTGAVVSYFSGVSGFTSGLSTVGYTVYDATGVVLASRSTTGVSEKSPGSYAATISLANGSYAEIRWDAGTSPNQSVSDFFEGSFSGSSSSYLSAVRNFTSGLSTVGYAIYSNSGSLLSARSTSGVSERSPGCYAALVSITAGTSGEVRWDTGTSTPVYNSDFFEAPGTSSGSVAGIRKISLNGGF